MEALFLTLEAALEIDLGHLFCFVTAIVVLILVTQLFLVFAVVAQQAVLGIRAYGFAAALRWEADPTKHARMLVLFANDQAYLAVLHRQDGCRVTVAALHEFNQPIRQVRLNLPDI